MSIMKKTESKKRGDLNQVTSPTALYLASLIDASPKTQAQIAQELGYNPNIVSMIKFGRFKVPTEKLKLFADVLGADHKEMVDRVLKEYIPGTLEEVLVAYGLDARTQSSKDVLEVFQSVSKSGSREFDTSKEKMDSLRKLLNSMLV